MQPLLIAVLPVAGVLMGAALQFFFGRSLEARKQLTVQRADSYIDFFRAVAALPRIGPKSNWQQRPTTPPPDDGLAHVLFGGQGAEG
jgi:hypothetical protein